MIPVFVLCLAMGLLDLFLSLLPFSIGIGERYQISNYASVMGFFILEKIIVTVLVAIGLSALYKIRPRIVWTLLFVMAGILLFQAWTFSHLSINPPPLPTNSEPPIYSSPYNYNVLPIQS